MASFDTSELFVMEKYVFKKCVLPPVVASSFVKKLIENTEGRYWAAKISSLTPLGP